MRRIRLPQQLLEAEVGDARMRKTNIRGRRFGSPCQRSVTTADGCRTGSECSEADDVGTHPGVYLLGDSRNSDERCSPWS